MIWVYRMSVNCQNMNKKAYIAGGCFWGMEELFRTRPGIIDTEVGYLGWENKYPSYRDHPWHAEWLELTYNPTETSFLKILDYFFCIHDPTTLNQQWNDHGSSYRSAIFYQNEEEKLEAREFIERVDISKRWQRPVATKLEEFTVFWPAEDSHQDYLQRNPGWYTCHFQRFESFL